MSFPGAGVEGGRERDVEGAQGVSPSPLHPLQVLPALAHYSLLMVVTGAECGQGRPGTEAPAAGGLTNGGWRGSGGEEGGVLAHQGASPGREADPPPSHFFSHGDRRPGDQAAHLWMPLPSPPAAPAPARRGAPWAGVEGCCGTPGSSRARAPHGPASAERVTPGVY